jgi:hypothetical protein
MQQQQQKLKHCQALYMPQPHLLLLVVGWWLLVVMLWVLPARQQPPTAPQGRRWCK